MPPDNKILYNERASSRKLVRHGILAVLSDILRSSFSLSDTVLSKVIPDFLKQSNSMLWPRKRIPYQPSNLGTATGASKKRSAAGISLRRRRSS